MDSTELKKLQAPLKEKYTESSHAAIITMRAESHISEGIACKVETGRKLAEAGLHPAAGGDGSQLCSGDMLLEALVACAGVTLKAVATAMGINLTSASVTAEGDLDFRGTLAVSRKAKVGFNDIRLQFSLQSDAQPDALDKLVELTERYCVVLQTLKDSPNFQSTVNYT
jgi:uncharacterized OsmC-like protein